MLTEPILSSDANAVEQLTEKLARLTEERDKMKAVNAAWRKFEKTGDAKELRAFGIDENVMREKIAAAYSWEKQPYVGWQLTNLGAQIRSVKERIENVSRVQAQPEQSIKSDGGIRYEDSPRDNRVRLFFPGKPDEATRSKLKSNGFRWTPSLGCWQAYRNYRAESLARSMIEMVAAPTVNGGCALIESKHFTPADAIDDEEPDNGGSLGEPETEAERNA